MATSTERAIEEVCRAERLRVLSALRRRHADPADCEDAAQQALLAASEQWPRDGIPDDPGAWLVRVASRRLVDQIRADRARAAREEVAARQGHALHDGLTWADADGDTVESSVSDDVVELMLRCAHPALSPTSRVALTLRAVGGLSTREIAAGFLVPEATMAQRISRAKATLATGVRLHTPDAADLPERMAAVRHVVSLIFTEGHQRSSGDHLVDTAFTDEAIRLARVLQRESPEGENAGLLALLLLTHARTPARTDARGDLVPLEQQDRTRWDAAMIAEGVGLLEVWLPRGEVGPFQLQAAVAAVHAEARSAETTDWSQILVLYRMLDALAPSAATTIALAAATGEVEGPQAGLAVLDRVADGRLHRVHAVRGHLLARLGDRAAAEGAWREAARLTRSIAEQRYLNGLIDDLAAGDLRDAPGDRFAPGR